MLKLLLKYARGNVAHTLRGSVLLVSLSGKDDELLEDRLVGCRQCRLPCGTQSMHSQAIGLCRARCPRQACLRVQDQAVALHGCTGVFNNSTVAMCPQPQLLL